MKVDRYRLAVGQGIRRSPFSGALSDARIRIRVTAKSARASQKEGFCIYGNAIDEGQRFSFSCWR